MIGPIYNLSGAHTGFKLLLPHKRRLLSAEGGEMGQHGPGVVEDGEEDLAP